MGTQTINVKVVDAAGNEISGSPFACSYEVINAPAVAPKTGVEVVTGNSLNPEDLLDNLPTGATATFDGTPDFTTVGTQTINVKVVDAAGNEISGSPFACSYEVINV